MFRFLFLLVLYAFPISAFADVRLAVLEFRVFGVNEAFLEVLSDKVRSVRALPWYIRLLQCG